MPTPHVSVCIASYRRPDGLRRLLSSLERQQDPPHFEIVVVDNDRERSAEPVVADFSDRMPVTYRVEPVRGLARVRNRAVAGGVTPFVAFIDDDEAAEPEWLKELAQTATEYNADVVIGPVSVRFESGVPDFIRTCGLFGDNLPCQGEVVRWFATRTSNAYVCRRSLPDQHAPFSERFDLTGGEDVDLFKRMEDAGATIVAARGAVVIEYRPAVRASLRWVVRRALRNGMTIACVTRKNASAAKLFRRALRSSQRSAVAAVKAGLDWRGDREQAMRHLLTACEEFGKVLYAGGFNIKEYRRHV